MLMRKIAVHERRELVLPGRALGFVCISFPKKLKGDSGRKCRPPMGYVVRTSGTGWWSYYIHVLVIKYIQCIT